MKIPEPSSLMDKIDLSVVVLAGGKSVRMGTDKSFLDYRGKPFIRVITDEMLKLSSDVIVVIGTKDNLKFHKFVSEQVRILSDSYDIQNPMGGMLSACEHLINKYAAFIGCDNPKIKSEVIRFLASEATGHSAAVPIWENKNTEPLCAVYNVVETREAGEVALREGKIGCRNLLSLMKDVNYVRVEKLKKFDPSLHSLININTIEDLKNLEQSEA